MFGKFMVSLPPPEEEEGKLNSAPEENLHVWRRRWHFFRYWYVGVCLFRPWPHIRKVGKGYIG